MKERAGVLVFLSLSLGMLYAAAVAGHTTEPVPSPTMFRTFDIPPPSPTPIAGLHDYAVPLRPAPTASPKPVRSVRQKAVPTAGRQRATGSGPHYIPAGAYRPWRTFSANVTRARAYALARLESVQFNCLDRLATRESGWRVHAYNKHSGAYGIPQALPGRKMAAYGSDWRDNATTQIKWMIHYVNVRYGSACSALQHAYDAGWY